jgi:hypothetical protein
LRLQLRHDRGALHSLDFELNGLLDESGPGGGRAVAVVEEQDQHAGAVGAEQPDHDQLVERAEPRVEADKGCEPHDRPRDDEAGESAARHDDPDCDRGLTPIAIEGAAQCNHEKAGSEASGQAKELPKKPLRG